LADPSHGITIRLPQTDTLSEGSMTRRFSLAGATIAAIAAVSAPAAFANHS
jgi:hypothetical protein